VTAIRKSGGWIMRYPRTCAWLICSAVAAVGVELLRFLS
jgi:hypothetical protein